MDYRDKRPYYWRRHLDSASHMKMSSRASSMHSQFREQTQQMIKNEFGSLEKRMDDKMDAMEGRLSHMFSTALKGLKAVPPQSSQPREATNEDRLVIIDTGEAAVAEPETLEEKKEPIEPVEKTPKEERLVIDKADLMNQFRLRFHKPSTQKAYKGHILEFLEQNDLKVYEAWTQR